MEHALEIGHRLRCQEISWKSREISSSPGHFHGSLAALSITILMLARQWLEFDGYKARLISPEKKRKN